MKKARILCVFFLISVSTALSAQALLIGTKSAPPFSFQDAKGTWQGISIDLWRDLARDLGLKYRLQAYPNLSSLFRLLYGLPFTHPAPVAQYSP